VLHLWVRATANWADERAFRAQLDPAFEPQVALWDDTFDMPYRCFRHQLRAIAQLNLSRVADAVVAAWDEIPDGALVAPVDDDDWFAPDVARTLERERAPHALGYVWTSSFLEVPIDLGHRLYLARRALFPRTPPRWLCTTNNYAAHKRPETELLLRSHTIASEHFAGADAARVVRLDRRLSVMNRTLASKTSLGFLKPAIRRGTLLRKLRRYRELYAAPPSHPDLDWCRPYLQMMSDLMRELHVK